MGPGGEVGRADRVRRPALSALGDVCVGTGGGEVGRADRVRRPALSALGDVCVGTIDFL